MSSPVQLVDTLGRSFPLREGQTRIGRNADNEIVLAESLVSRHHATIFSQGGQLYLRDENSKNGTRLNGQRVTGTQPLKIGDRIKIGRTEFTVQMGTVPAPGEYAVPHSPGRTAALPFILIGAVAVVAILLLLFGALMNRAPAALPTVVAVVTTVPSPIPSVSPVPTPTTAPTSPPASVPKPSPVPNPSPSATSEADNLPTLPPPLADVPFPSQSIPYPADWPAEIRYPDSFRLVDVTGGVMPIGSSRGWAAKLLYAGSPKNAETALASFFTARGWLIAEQVQLDSGGLLLVLQRGSKAQSGVLVIDSDARTSGSTRILATIIL